MLDIVQSTMFMLFLASTLYAFILNSIQHWYQPHGVIWTVVGGVILVWWATTYLYNNGIPTTPLLIVQANIVAGIPMFVWQGIQYYYAKRAEFASKHKHAERENHS